MPDNNAQNDLLDILFQRRNKAYGAYALRRSYFRHLKIAFVTGVLLFFILLYLPMLAENGFGFSKKKKLRALPPVEMPKLPPVDIRKLQPERKLPPKPPATKAKPAANSSKSGASTDVQPDEFADPTDAPPDTPGKDTTSLTKEKPDSLETSPTKPPVKQEEPQETEFEVVVQQLPGYVGGDTELWKYVYANLQYPQGARDLGLEGTVIVQFTVNKDGKLSDIKCVQDIGGGCGDEAARLVRRMPAWIPGVYQKRPVKFRLRMPIEFRLDK